MTLIWPFKKIFFDTFLFQKFADFKNVCLEMISVFKSARKCTFCNVPFSYIYLHRFTEINVEIMKISVLSPPQQPIYERILSKKVQLIKTYVLPDDICILSAAECTFIRYHLHRFYRN